MGVDDGWSETVADELTAGVDEVVVPGDDGADELDANEVVVVVDDEELVDVDEMVVLVVGNDSVVVVVVEDACGVGNRNLEVDAVVESKLDGGVFRRCTRDVRSSPSST